MGFFKFVLLERRRKTYKKADEKTYVSKQTFPSVNPINCDEKKERRVVIINFSCKKPWPFLF